MYLGAKQRVNIIVNLQKTVYAPGEDIILQIISDNKECIKALLELEVSLKMKVQLTAKGLFGDINETMTKKINALKGLPCEAHNCVT